MNLHPVGMVETRISLRARVPSLIGLAKNTKPRMALVSAEVVAFGLSQNKEEGGAEKA